MRGGGLALLVVAAIALGGCGVSEETAPRFRDRAEMPFGLDERPSTTTTEPVAGPTASVICFVDADDTVVRRSGGTDASLLARLRAIPGPDDDDLTTAVPDPEMVTAAVVREGVAEIDLRRDFAELSATTQRLVAAELVCTATATLGVGQVLFTLDETPLSVPRGDGSLTEARLTLDDYTELLDGES